MGRIRFNTKYFMALLVGAAMFSCSDDALMEAPQLDSVTETENVATLVAGFSEGSRLAYEKQGDAIKITWAKGDVLVANPSPADEGFPYEFNLSNGDGTVNGIFICSGAINNIPPQNYTSNAWTIYYPGSSIQGEQDWLNFSYLGQKQKGNDNLDHLKNFHSMRLAIGGKVAFNDTYIDFSGDNVDQSMCVKFNLSEFPSITPTKLELMYMNEKGAFESCFHTYNYLSSVWIGANPNPETMSRMTLGLENITSTTSLTAYMMMSNYPFTVKNGGNFRVYLTASNGKKYYCDVLISQDVTLRGGYLYNITCSNWKEALMIDGFENSDNGVVVLQKATAGNPGTDIIIMGDGFNKDHFGANGDYATIMENAYEDFFSVEPYKSLRDYFNVYYINAVSKDNHDAEPYYDEYGSQNGATNGDANTVFSTKFTPNSTHITGNNDLVLEYARQAIRSKGGANGIPVSDENMVNTRVDKSLMIVMVNVPCYAGTCAISYDPNSTEDYCNVYSIGYTSLGNDKTGVQCKWTNLHENAGHGFGKLGDEYNNRSHESFNTSDWSILKNQHDWGLFRNVDEYWCSEYVKSFNSTLDGKEFTSDTNVYWSALFSSDYGYKATLSDNSKGEELGIYKGAYTFKDFYCRSTDNSIMNYQLGENGQFFNAISRWAIWYRVMRLTNSISETTFASSLNEFIAFESENGYTVKKNVSLEGRSVLRPQEYKPLAPPELIKGQWINGRFVKEK